MIAFNRLFPQLGATQLDATLFEIAVIICVVLLVYNLFAWFSHLKSDHRTFEDCTNDIRAMNNYNSYFTGAIIVFFGLIVEKGGGTVPVTSIMMFLAAFVCAASAIFFVPIEKPQTGAATLPKRRRWLWALIPTQWTVILATVALLNVVLSLLMKRS